MQGFEGFGYNKAKATVEYYGGLPFVIPEGTDLTDVPGVGAGLEAKVRKVIG